MDDTILKQYENTLNPNELKPNLIFSALYISAFEILKDSIIDRIKSFFTDGFDGKDFIVNDKYASEVLSLNRSPLYASLNWLKRMNAIDKKDFETFEAIKKCRNYMAHEMINIISNGVKKEDVQRFVDMIELLKKIELWWIINVDIPTDQDLSQKSIDIDEILPGPIIYLKLLLNIALGDEEEALRFYKQFQQEKPASS